MKTASKFLRPSVFFFFMPFILLYSVWIRSAAGEETARIPFDKINAIKIKETYDMFSKTIPPRGEFETKPEYHQRIVNYLLDSPLLNGSFDHYFYLFIDDVDFNYFVDEGEGEFFRGFLMRTQIADDDDDEKKVFFLGVKGEARGYSIGEEKKMGFYSGDIYGLYFNDQSKDLEESPILFQPKWRKKMSIEEGKAIKNNCGAIVQFQFNPKLLSDKTGVTRKEHVRYGGTFEDWTSLSCNLFGFPAKKVRMTFFNQQTGEIVHDIKFDEYKSEETLRAEEEIRKVKEEKRKAEEAKRQAEKREMEFIKKNIFFFVDWKTPNGNMNAKYVTMNGENVVLEDEEGKRIEFPAEYLDEQNQELLVLAKCFTRVKHKLQKERVWTYANEWIYTDVESDASQKSRKKSSGTSKKSHKKPRTIRGRLLFMTDKALLIEDDKGKKRTVLKSDLIDKDVQWVQRTHQVFLDKLSEYEEKYGVRLLEPINPYDIDPRYIEID